MSVAGVVAIVAVAAVVALVVLAFKNRARIVKEAQREAGQADAVAKTVSDVKDAFTGPKQ